MSSITFRPKKLSVTPALACGASVARRALARRGNLLTHFGIASPQSARLAMTGVIHHSSFIIHHFPRVHLAPVIPHLLTHLQRAFGGLFCFFFFAICKVSPSQRNTDIRLVNAIPALDNVIQGFVQVGEVCCAATFA